MLDKLLRSLRVAPTAGTRRFGSVGRYLKRIGAALGDAVLAEHLKVDRAELARAVRAAKNTLTFFDADTATPVGLARAAGAATPEGWTRVVGADVETFGAAPKGDAGEAYKLTTGSLMDFDCVVTTARRDRDGDVLDPKGAIVDPKMPLLWQHVPFQPIGRMVRLTEQDDSKVAARFCILDTPLGRDAAVLVAGGALRISHGFSPIDYIPLKDDQGKDLGGWKINKYAMMEASTVSIPSNVDAEITAFSQGKLHHPLVKAWCGMLDGARAKLFTANGAAGRKSTGGPAAAPAPQNVTVTIELKGLPQAAPAAPPAPPAKPGKGKGAKAGDPPADDEDDDDKDEDAEEPTDTEDPADKADDDADADEEAAEEGTGKAGRALGDIIQTVRDLAKTADLPKEAVGRLSVVNGMMEDLEAGMDAAADALGTAAKARDLMGCCTAMAAMVEGCMGQLRGITDELARVGAIPDMPAKVAGGLADIAKEAGQIVDAVGAMTEAAKADDRDPAAEGDDPADGETDETAELDDDVDEHEEGKAEADDFADDEEDEEEKADDDDDTDEYRDDEADEEKADADDDDDEAGEKDGVDPDEENPEAEADPDEENPGAGDGKSLDRLLGRHLAGERLDADALAVLRREFGRGLIDGEKKTKKARAGR